MRIVVTSDSHRRVNYLIEIFERHKENADLFINLGDGEDDVDTAVEMYPNVKIERVAGNCDFSSNLPLYKTITFAGKKILFTHGHPFYVKHGYEMIKQEAKKQGVDICLFGHTHYPMVEIEDGIYFMNPGAVCDSNYGIIDIIDKGIMAYNAQL